MKFPITICLWCNEENPKEDHKSTCAETYKPKKFVPPPEWISLKDKLPDQHELVLLYAKKVKIGYRVTDWFATESGESISAPVTHYMKLPEPPK